MGAAAAAGCEEDEALELVAAVRARFVGGIVAMFGVATREPEAWIGNRRHRGEDGGLNERRDWLKKTACRHGMGGRKKEILPDHEPTFATNTATRRQAAAHNRFEVIL